MTWAETFLAVAVWFVAGCGYVVAVVSLIGGVIQNDDPKDAGAAMLMFFVSSLIALLATALAAWLSGI